ncbi:MAG: ADP-ribosylglycohydrolase family protein, partial [Bacteroidales bacterium]|nr:ADP-ribosylglycohydrolase family protein [Bacteroidales bacterium]
MAIKGAILGDIIGSSYERYKCQTPKSAELFTVENRFTDDTVLTVAIADYLLHRSSWSIDETLRHYTGQYPHRGYGGGYWKWVKKDPTFMPSFGNGSAMRISAVADFSKSIDELEELVEEVTIPTHNTIDGLTGARVIATCAYMAKNGESKDAILNYAATEYPEILDTRYNKLGYPWSAICKLSVPLAVRCFYDSTSYEDCMRKV